MLDEEGLFNTNRQQILKDTSSSQTLSYLKSPTQESGGSVLASIPKSTQACTPLHRLLKSTVGSKLDEGAADGKALGLFDGDSDGDLDGLVEGWADTDGPVDGSGVASDGLVEGALDADGWPVGVSDGMSLGMAEVVGVMEGSLLGLSEGS